MTSIIRGEGRGPEVDQGVGLEGAEFYRALAPGQRGRVASLLRTKRLAAAEILFLEGQPAEYLWTLARGSVRLFKTSPDGRLTTLETLGPGEVFGALSALEDDRYPASAETISAVDAWCLPRAVFLRLLAEEPRLAVDILGIVSRRLRQAHERMRSFAHDAAPARLARELLRVARHGEAQVTRRALAEAAGTTVETAIRALRQLHRRGVIRAEVGRVRVLDERALRALAGEG
jgi:CRP-like cAMP-binding protein